MTKSTMPTLSGGYSMAYDANRWPELTTIGRNRGPGAYVLTTPKGAELTSQSKASLVRVARWLAENPETTPEWKFIPAGVKFGPKFCNV